MDKVLAFGKKYVVAIAAVAVLGVVGAVALAMKKNEYITIVNGTIEEVADTEDAE